MTATIPRTRQRWLWLLLSLASCMAVVLVLLRPSPATIPSHQSSLQLDGHWVPSSLRVSANTLLADPRQPSLLLAGTANGVWRSSDAGVLWRHDMKSPGGDIFALAASSQAGAILAGAFDGRVYAGSGPLHESWQPISPVLSPYPVFSLAVAPDGSTALAGTLGTLFRGQKRTNGWQWRPVISKNGVAITSIAWAPWDPRLVFATFFHTTPSVLLSRDGGLTWQSDTSNLPNNLPTQSLLPGEAATREVMVSTMGGGVWLRSAEGSWHDISAGLPQRHAMPIAGNPGVAGVLFAGTMGRGVYEKQGQAAWQSLGHGLQGMSALVLSLLAPSAAHPNLLAGTGQGLFRYVPSASGSATPRLR